MRAAATVAGVLGTGSVLVFAMAGLVATLFPSGTLINAGWNGAWGGGWAKPGIGMPVPLPAPMPPGAEGGKVFVGGGGTVTVNIDTAPLRPTGTDDDVVAQP